MIEHGCGWGDRQKPPAYYKARDLRRHLSLVGLGSTALAWDLEMVTRDIRHASTELERQRAVARLNNFMATIKLPEYVKWKVEA